MNKEKLIRLIKKKNGYNNRTSVRYIVIGYCIVHLLFWASSFIPDSNRYTASSLRSVQNLSQYNSVTLIRWDYAPSDNTMEVVFDLTNTLYQDGSISMEARSSNKRLDSKIVYSDQDMLIVQLYKVPKASGNRITIRFEYEENGKETSASFYTYVGITNQVKSLPVLTEKEYYYNRQVYDINYYNSLISELEDKITANKEKIDSLEKDLERLSDGKENLTSDELLNLDETITNDTQSIKSLELQISEYENDISGYQDTIKVLEERRDACE